eukprot:4026769-Amphidinium_carterae.2
MKVVGLQRTVSSNHARLTALEESTRHLRTATANAENRVDERFERLGQHIVLVDDILGSHTGSIRRMNEEAHQREEAQVYSSMGRDNELSNRLAGCEGRAHQLSQLVHELCMIRANENNVPAAKRPVLRPVAPNPEDQHG